MSTAVKADPTKPWKAYAATLVALIGLIWANLQGVEDWGTLDFQDWVTIVVPAVLVFGATYFVENPAAPKGPGEYGYGVLGFVGAVLLVGALILLFTTLLKVLVVSIPVLIVLALIGVVCLFFDGRAGRGRVL